VCVCVQTLYTLHTTTITTTTQTMNHRYSYAADEDRAVKDPWLAEHLAKRGINIMECVKTEKTTQEMSLDASLKMDLFAVDSEGKKLERVNGAGRVGLTNLGNTCYMNSCLQLLFSLPETKKRYLNRANDTFLSSSDPVSIDLNAQMSKLAVGLLSNRYCGNGEEEDSVRPRMFKSLIGKGHSLFSTNKQQDALEFWQHLLSCLDSVEKGEPSTNSLFEFETESRKECVSTGGVKYVQEETFF
jgi:ubiquitin carboxyl-terminal hydrolase 5/13